MNVDTAMSESDENKYHSPHTSNSMSLDMIQDFTDPLLISDVRNPT